MDAVLSEALQRLRLTDFKPKLQCLGIHDASDVLILNDLDLGGIGMTIVQIRKLQKELTPSEEDSDEDAVGHRDSMSSAKSATSLLSALLAVPSPGIPNRRLSQQSRWWRNQLNRPQRLIFIRHGESEANVDRSITLHVPDWMLHLTEKGRNQALDAGVRLKSLIGDETVKFIISPYVRTQETFNGIKQAWGDGVKVPVRMDVRIREQEFGNYDHPDMKALHGEKKAFGAFFYRFPDGESPADCFDRASSFFETMYRAWEDNTYKNHVVVGHGMMILMMLMRLFKFSIDEWESLESLQNCEFVVLERPPDDGKYRIGYSWAGGENRKLDGLRKKPNNAPKASEVPIWDGSETSPMLRNQSRRHESTMSSQ